MGHLRLSTAGESHGPAEVCIIDGVPAGLPLSREDIDADLSRRQQGYGRGGRMLIETDRCRFLAGVRLGKTLGTPICILVENRDHANWTETMGVEEPESDPPAAALTVPRPGHADLAGAAKFAQDDLRNVLERASARETVGRVAGGAVAKRLLLEAGVHVQGRVLSVGSVSSTSRVDFADPASVDWTAVERSSFGCDDERADARMREEVDTAREAGESLGGVFEIWCWGLCPGLGGFNQPGDRLDGRLLGAVASIPAIKGVEVGEAFAGAKLSGSKVHDHIVLLEQEDSACVGRPTNRCAGTEGGISNGMPLVIRAAMKPIPTLTRPLPSVDLRTMTAVAAHVERSDVSAVTAARVVGEAMVALVVADAYLDKFGGDHIADFRQAVAAYEKRLGEKGLWRRS
ncbi:MAG TPA: chorismate synthase [Thermoleophilia bacterium]